MAIFVNEGHSQGPQTRGVRLLGGCIYYAEYGICSVICMQYVWYGYYEKTLSHCFYTQTCTQESKKKVCPLREKRCHFCLGFKCNVFKMNDLLFKRVIRWFSLTSQFILKKLWNSSIERGSWSVTHPWGASSVLPASWHSQQPDLSDQLPLPILLVTFKMIYCTCYCQKQRKNLILIFLLDEN